MSQAQTTSDEYDYSVKGYPLALSAGLDIKTGYKVEPGFTKTVVIYKMQVNYLVRHDGAVAAIILCHENTLSSRKEFFCIPDPKSDPSILKLAHDAYSPFTAAAAKNGESYAEFEFLFEALQQTVGRCQIK